MWGEIFVIIKTSENFHFILYKLFAKHPFHLCLIYFFLLCTGFVITITVLINYLEHYSVSSSCICFHFSRKIRTIEIDYCNCFFKQGLQVVWFFHD